MGLLQTLARGKNSLFSPHKALHSRNASILSAFLACELYSPFYSYSYLKIHVQGFKGISKKDCTWSVPFALK
jgi:hypothetical protein